MINDDEIVEEMTAKRETNKLYKRAAAYPEISDAIKAERISAAVSQHREMLHNFDQRVNLRDVEAVKDAVDRYMQSCEASATVPTFLGVASFLGYSRSGVYAWMARNTDSETTAFLDAFRSASASIIAQGSLTRSLDNASSIFLLKNSGQGLSDKSEIELTRGLDPKPRRTAQEIIDAYAEIGGLPDC